MSSFERHAHLLGFLARQAVQERGYWFGVLIVVELGLISVLQVVGVRFTLQLFVRRWHAWVQAQGWES